MFTHSSYPRDVTTRSGSEPEAADGGDPATEAWRLITAVMMARKQQFPQIAASFKLNPGALHALLTLDRDIPQRMSVLAGGGGCDASNGLCAGDPCATVNCNQPPSTCHQSTGVCAGGTCTYALMPAMQTNIGLHLFTGLLLVAGYAVATF